MKTCHNSIFSLDIQKKLRQIPTSNLNSSGGGIDAIMRAIDEIEWRQASRRILVVATNSVSQYVENANGQVYTNYMTGEVPSIEELDKKVRQNQVIILFAVTTPVYRTYENIVYEITGSSIGTLDSANIVELIRNEYNVRTLVRLKAFYKSIDFPENFLIRSID